MKVSHRNNRLVIRSEPEIHWMMGGALTLLGMAFTIGLWSALANNTNVALSLKLLMTIIGLTAAAGGLYFIYQYPLVETVFDHTTRQIVIRHRWPFKTTQQTYPLDAIQAVRVQESYDGEGEPRYQIILEMEAVGHLQLSNFWSYSEDNAYRTAEAIRDYAGRLEAR